MAEEERKSSPDQKGESSEPEVEILPAERKQGNLTCSPEDALGIKPSRFGFINRRNKDRIEAYTGVINAATGLVESQTGLEKAKAKLLNVEQEIDNDLKAEELRALDLGNQIEEKRKELEKRRRLGPLQDELEEEDLRLKLETARRDREKLGKEAKPERRLTRREKLAREKARLEARMERLIWEKGDKIGKAAGGMSQDRWTSEILEEVTRIANMYDDAIQRAREELSKCL